ncbi:uncharacterized protein B0T15DRAFT_522042 [Chaetomium strumarium]|uniref:Uncharacterized protein n=1 Tax=Chaetomium strumarium TaxID=1170767 RepID=A0AAJ0M7E5_9PEZI|nr:hypothetical protein B0T15DRAFT_522042 [Chaetomium strumarium]
MSVTHGVVSSRLRSCRGLEPECAPDFINPQLGVSAGLCTGTLLRVGRVAPSPNKGFCRSSSPVPTLPAFRLPVHHATTLCPTAAGSQSSHGSAPCSFLRISARPDPAWTADDSILHGNFPSEELRRESLQESLPADMMMLRRYRARAGGVALQRGINRHSRPGMSRGTGFEPCKLMDGVSSVPIRQHTHGIIASSLLLFDFPPYCDNSEHIVM